MHIHVYNVWQTCTWYQDVLGMAATALRSDGSEATVVAAGIRLVFVADQAEELLAQTVRKNSFLHAPAGFHLVFEVADVPWLYERALTHGGIGVTEPIAQSGGQRKAWLRDLNGELIELTEAGGDAAGN